MTDDRRAAPPSDASPPLERLLARLRERITLLPHAMHAWGRELVRLDDVLLLFHEPEFLAEGEARRRVPRQETMMSNPFLIEWHDAVNCATEWIPDSPAGRWMARVSAAGEALARDYVKLAERADREARLAVALRTKLHDMAGPEIASAIHVD